MAAYGRTFKGDIHKKYELLLLTSRVLAVADGKVVEYKMASRKHPHSDKLAVKWVQKHCPE